MDTSGKSQILWSFPFDRLKVSADDGQRLLWLDFGGDEGEQVGKLQFIVGHCHNIYMHSYMMLVSI